MQGNGSDDFKDSVIAAFEKVAAVVARATTAIRSMDEEQRAMRREMSDQGARREREAEKARERDEAIRELIVILTSHVTEARDDLERLDEKTDPHGFKLLDSSGHPLREKESNDSGKLVAFARLAEKVPTAWVAGLLKLAVSAGLGGAALRALQWLANGH